MRAFIGTLLSAANQDAADAFGAEIAAASLRVLRPVPLRSAHVTHLFLGDVDERLLRAIIGDLQDLMATLTPVPFGLGRPEVLRAGREPRLVLASVERGGPGVSRVTRRIADRLGRHRELAELKPARSPHVTLGRFRRGGGPKDAARVAELIAGLHGRPLWQDERLDAVELVQSELTPTGPIYKVLVRAPAGGPA